MQWILQCFQWWRLFLMSRYSCLTLTLMSNTAVATCMKPIPGLISVPLLKPGWTPTFETQAVLYSLTPSIPTKVIGLFRHVLSKYSYPWLYAPWNTICECQNPTSITTSPWRPAANLLHLCMLWLPPLQEEKEGGKTRTVLICMLIQWNVCKLIVWH